MSIDEGGPFDDPLFAAIARHHGCHDRGSHWHLVDLSPMHGEGRDDWGRATARGFDSDRLRGHPAGMPRFRFARDGGQASLMIDGGPYIYSNRAGARQITILGATLPETLVAAAAGRPLSDYVELPGASDEIIDTACHSAMIGKDTAVIILLR